MLVMPVMLGGFSIPHSLSFLEGFSYTKNNGYLGVIMHLSGVFNRKTQLIDALIESYAEFSAVLRWDKTSAHLLWMAQLSIWTANSH